MRINLAIRADEFSQPNNDIWEFVDIMKTHGFILRNEYLEDRNVYLLHAFISDIHFNMMFKKHYENVDNTVYPTNPYERELYNFDYENGRLIIHDIDSNEIKLNDTKYKNRLYFLAKDLIELGVITN